MKTVETILNLHDITTKIDKTILHDKLNLNVNRGEIIGIVGGSGSGKSVLLRVILGLMPYESGQIHLFNCTMAHGIEAKKIYQRCAVMFQSGALFSSLTVLENIQLPLREIAKKNDKDSSAIAFDKLAMVGLEKSVGQKYPAELSGGMIKRAALARALALNAELLFLDEPTAGLDPISAESFDELLQKLQREHNLTVIMVTHDLDSLYAVCDRVAVLLDKKVVVGTIEEFVINPHPWIQNYFRGSRGRAAHKTIKEH